VRDFGAIAATGIVLSSVFFASVILFGILVLITVAWVDLGPAIAIGVPTVALWMIWRLFRYLSSMER
jgi:hypothetical protein